MMPRTLNRKVKLQSLTAGQDEYGAPSTVWTDTATVWASVDDLTGREYVAAGGTQNAVTTKITIRYREGVVPAMRVLHGAFVYTVEAVLGQDQKSLILMCVRGSDNG